MNFGKALERVKLGGGMRLPNWKTEAMVKCKYPQPGSDMTMPYLYIENRYGRVPWKENIVELFSNEWEVL